MLLDMYLFFCLPFPAPRTPKAKPAPRRGRASGRGSTTSRTPPRRVVKAASGKADKPSTGARRTSKPALRVLDGGRAGVR
ncbi:hypothetical protein HUA74_37185 [Myxococcus sp. CA051A]|uniref:Uncharacterized protein n=1 Tax=Myxococcus llanfairpwllgwyngyllgogerychwyrndrobwllllantysiliogogogochensis TaxID=2590453 RepID=A0A540WPG3_9BACT|nr:MULTISPECIES: hypothetical protein [Myxococcus]NTX08989.1 hypothetical protein [Myxococcus sp. CA040A]NTX16935.1 hypothetical protein [Myxococcus sp. CA056]NTX36675.1 hypothetical protein [Myxococcus sp. CA033]NTX66307.1 hypothetical protein [Myxococcus sp. CA051A]TQF10880.1 hypothetical protein FJV41_37195 [Myxococcus llanfairpwllgwyngyllgogerychwyrndrobwllllantysiliogogogochensis]